jgi:hypothetical protein
MGWRLGLAPATLEFWVRFQTRGTRENRAPPCVKVPGSLRVPADGMSSQRNQSDSFRFKRRGILPVAEEQSRTRGSQSGGFEDQPQCRGMWHSGRPSERSLSRSPSPPPPSFTQSLSLPRSLVRDGQTSPHRPRLVVSHSTCPPLSPSPHANSFLIGTAVINTHSKVTPQKGCACMCEGGDGKPSRLVTVLVVEDRHGWSRFWW